MTILLDTSAYSSLFKIELKVDLLLETATTIFMSPIVIGELSHGYMKGSRYGENMRQLESFLSEKNVEVCEIGKDIAKIYSEIKYIQQGTGKNLAPNDLWIAASAASMGAKLVTLDRDFLRIEHRDFELIIL